MNTIKTTLITNVYNEEYLLPFWLTHHKDMFDDLIIIDYNSTDKSMEICKTIWPECKIITCNNHFDAEENDVLIMNIENGIEGIKIFLNTTEFLLCETSVRDIFDTSSMLYRIRVSTPYSKNYYDINTYDELFKNLLNDDILYDHYRGYRYIHNHSNGDYHVGRHTTNHTFVDTDKAHIIWFGYYPMNDRLLERKLQIKPKMSQRDINENRGYQHKFTKEEMFNIMNNNLASSAKPLKEYNLGLYNLLNKK
jgi:hypothetical protein